MQIIINYSFRNYKNELNGQNNINKMTLDRTIPKKLKYRNCTVSRNIPKNKYLCI